MSAILVILEETQSVVSWNRPVRKVNQNCTRERAWADTAQSVDNFLEMTNRLRCDNTKVNKPEEEPPTEGAEQAHFSIRRCNQSEDVNKAEGYVSDTSYVA